MPATGSDSYAVLLPVKPPGRGKTRLGDLPRDLLAAAFAMDTATAASYALFAFRVNRSTGICPAPRRNLPSALFLNRPDLAR